MRQPALDTITVSQSADEAFQAALGVAQNTKNHRILAVHNDGRKLVLREKSKMSIPKFFQVWVEEKDGGAELKIVAGADPRTPKAMLDSTVIKRALKKYMEQVQAVLNGSQSAPVTPVDNHYLAKKTEVPWENADEDPQIELDGNFLAMYGR